MTLSEQALEAAARAIDGAIPNDDTSNLERIALRNILFKRAAQAAVEGYLSALPVDDDGLVRALRFHGRYGGESNDQAAIRRKNEREQAADTITRLLSELSVAREALGRIVGGDIPRPLGKRWRADGKFSKLDFCIHGLSMSDDCGNCTADFARAALPIEDTSNP